ncbi:MAG: 50S ribosomal protein L17 [candidate division KSB1 bacterium]|nr:50S ribosomal protein L17 [candidate division KSB1 bacterium]MDZ7317770.1 50S ribosomal protein L17 [candidate division KSB1 bacterium]MDZ7339960.1 50S ribosomal protein L17 [candidate division KSB1 bacterium]
MRHRKSFNKLGRTASHRKALLSNLTTELFLHKRIKTTQVKAKALRPLAERLISFAKEGTLSARRQVLRTVRNKKVIKELFDEIAPVFASRNGGYTRIIKLGRRSGDGAEVAYLELVGFEGVKKEKKEKKEKKTIETKEKEEKKATETESTAVE